MARFMHTIESFTLRRGSCLVLAIFWTLGLGAGGLVFRYAGESIVSMMPLAASGQSSIVSLFLRASLPFLICAAAAFFQKPRLVPVVCFAHSFLYGYMVSAVFSAFGESGWLLRWLLLFTTTFSSGLLYGYARRHVTGIRPFSPRELMVFEFLLAALVFLDHYHVMPLLRLLLS